MASDYSSNPEMVPLGDIIAELEGGVSVKAGDRPSGPGERGVLKVSAVSDGHFRPNENKVVPPRSYSKLTLSVSRGDLIISRANTPELVGACGLVHEDRLDLYLPDKLWKIHLHDARRDSVEWLCLVLCSPAIRAQLRARASGTGRAMKNISKPALLGIKVHRPSREDQDRLADAFRSYADIGKTLSKLYQVKKAFLRGLMQQLLTGRRRLPAFADGAWDSTPLSSFVEPTSETNGPMITDRVLSCTKLYGIIAQAERFKQRIASADVSHYQIVRRTDLVFDPMLLWDTSIGFVENYDIGVVSPAYTTFRFTQSESDRRYIRWLLRSHRARHMYKVISQGTNQRRRKAPTKAFLKIEFEMPTGSGERAAIADILDTAQREIELLEQLREQIQLQKRGLMQKLLTGEIRVLAEAPAAEEVKT